MKWFDNDLIPQTQTNTQDTQGPIYLHTYKLY